MSVILIVGLEQMGLQGSFKMQWLTECIKFHGADNSRQKEQHMKMSGSQMFLFLRAEFVEFLSQRRSRDVLMESTLEDSQKGKQGQFQRKRSDKVLTFCTRFVLQPLYP